MGNGTAAASAAGIPNYLIWSVVCTIFFFTPAGLVGVISSVVSRRRARSGDLDGALRASRLAKTCCWVSLTLGLVAYLLVATGVIHLPSAKP